MIVVSSKGFISMAGQGHTDHAVPSYYLPEMGSLSSLPSCLNIKFGQYGGRTHDIRVISTTL